MRRQAAATVRPADYRALTKLRDARGERFKAGVVFYTGAETRALTDRIWALPVSALWGVEDPLVTAILSPGSVAVQDQRGYRRASRND